MSVKARRDCAMRHLPPWLVHGYGAEGPVHWNTGADNQGHHKPNKRRSTACVRTSLTSGSLSGSTSSVFDSSIHPNLIVKRLSSAVMIPAMDRTVFVEGEKHDCLEAGCERVTINVSGQKFETQLRTLNRFPMTLLGDSEKRLSHWDPVRQEFFLDRHRPTFQAVLYFYQSGGRLRRPVEVPEDVFLEELEFYQLGEEVITSFRFKEGILGEVMVDEDLDLLPENCCQKKLWLFCEEPDSSIPAKIFAIISIVCIIVSVTSFCLETLPVLYRPMCVNVTQSYYAPNITHRGPDNDTYGSFFEDRSSFNGSHAYDYDDDDDDDGLRVRVLSKHNYLDAFFVIETICVIWFTFEFMLRFISSPSKLKFCKSIMNIFDLLAILPYFVVLVTQLSEDSCDGEKSAGGSFVIVRILRVVRIFKLSKHSQGLRILGLTIKTSMHELGMFFFFLIVAMVIFSSAVYYAEAGEANTKLDSIPGAFWWAVVTMTTVGYGDVTPVGVWGKLVGTLCVIAGVLTIALPVPVVVANFNNFYRHES